MRYSIISLFVLLGLLGQACNGGSSSSKAEEYTQIIMSHPWKYDYDAIVEAVDFSQMNPTQADMVKGLSEIMSKANIAFLPDSVTVITHEDGSRTTGRWFVSEDAKYLYLQASAAGGEPQMIKEVTKERIWVENDPEKSFPFPKIFIPTYELE